MPSSLKYSESQGNLLSLDQAVQWPQNPRLRYHTSTILLRLVELTIISNHASVYYYEKLNCRTSSPTFMDGLA